MNAPLLSDEQIRLSTEMDYESPPREFEHKYGITGIACEYRLPRGLTPKGLQQEVERTPYRQAKIDVHLGGYRGFWHAFVHDPEKLRRYGVSDEWMEYGKLLIEQGHFDYIAQSMPSALSTDRDKIEAPMQKKYEGDPDKRFSLCHAFECDPQNPFRGRDHTPEEMAVLERQFLDWANPLWSELVRMNPELRGVIFNRNDAEDMHGALLGVASQFRAEDINAYFGLRIRTPEVQQLYESHFAEGLTSPNWVCADSTVLDILQKIYPDIVEQETYQLARQATQGRQK